MTNKGQTTSTRWFKDLLQHLPLKKITRAQAGNYVMDGIGALCFIAFMFTKPPPTHALIALVSILLTFVWCHNVSRPRR